MPPEPGGLAATVRQQLDEGHSADAVIQELIARGLSKSTAERFVNRALAERVPEPAWIPSEPIPSLRPSTESPSLTDYLRNPQGVAEQQAFNYVTRGAITMSVGIVMSALFWADTGRALQKYGLIAVGLFLFGRGVVLCGRLDGPFPRKRVLASAAMPGIALAAALVYIGWTVVAEKREVQAAVAAKAAAATAAEALRAEQHRAADGLRAEQQRAATEARREADARAAERADTSRQEAQLVQAMRDVRSGRPGPQCEGALVLGRVGSKEHVPLLVNLLATGMGNSRVCSAGALLGLGETDLALAAYLEWAKSDNPNHYAAAVSGFGNIGPSAADVAMPHLAKALTSPQPFIRQSAVESLAKLGPAGVPLLKKAVADTDTLVRAAAVKALAGNP